MESSPKSMAKVVKRQQVTATVQAFARLTYDDLEHLDLDEAARLKRQCGHTMVDLDHVANFVRDKQSKSGERSTRRD